MIPVVLTASLMNQGSPEATSLNGHGQFSGNSTEMIVIQIIFWLTWGRINSDGCS